MFSDFPEMFSDDHKCFWIFSKCFIDVLLMFSRCSLDVLLMFAGFSRMLSGCSDGSCWPGGIR